MLSSANQLFVVSLTCSERTFEVSNIDKPFVVNGIYTNFKTSDDNKITCQMILANVTKFDRCVRVVEALLFSKISVINGVFNVNLTFDTEDKMNEFIEEIICEAGMDQIRQTIQFDNELSESQKSRVHGSGFTWALYQFSTQYNVGFNINLTLIRYLDDTFCLDTTDEKAVKQFVICVLEKIVNTIPQKIIEKMQTFILIIMDFQPIPLLQNKERINETELNMFIEHNTLVPQFHKIINDLLQFITNDTFANNIVKQGGFNQFSIQDVKDQLNKIQMTSVVPHEKVIDISSIVVYEKNAFQAMNKLNQLFEKNQIRIVIDK